MQQVADQPYVVVIEPAEDGSFSAHVPDLPSCVACGDTVDEVERLIAEAVGLHVDSLRRQGEPVPPATSRATTVRAA